MPSNPLANHERRTSLSSFSHRLQSPLRFLTRRTSEGERLDPNLLEAGLNPQHHIADSQNASGESRDIADVPLNTEDDHRESKPDSEWRDRYSTYHLEHLEEEKPLEHTSRSPQIRFSDVHPFETAKESVEQESAQREDTPVTAESSAQELPNYTEQAEYLVRTLTSGDHAPLYSKPRSGKETPNIDKYISDLDYVPAPTHYKPSIFGTILTSRLNELQERPTTHRHDSHHRRSQPAEYLDLARSLIPQDRKHARGRSWEDSPRSSGRVTPKKPKWHERPEHDTAMANMLVQAGMSTTGPGLPKGSQAAPRARSPPPKPGNLISSAVEIIKNPGAASHGRKKSPANKTHDVVAEVATILARRKYLTKLCDAFMKCGAPTHRIEAYLAASAHAVCIDADFMYIPGAMMCTFIDHTLHTNSVELIRRREGLDLGRLKDVFNVYKCVIHEKYTAEEAIFELDNIQTRPERYGVWFRIFIFGLASVFVAPFSFNARPVDFGPIFLLGCALGYLQLKVVPRSEQFSNVFEVFACVLIAFIARGIGSIRSNGQYVFCFSATAQSSIAMILPGFLVLNSALELQSRNVVAGSVRMVYAIIYVLFLGFGLLVGTTIFGLVKRDAVTDVTCHAPDWWSAADSHWKLIYTQFVWVPLFACCIAIVYRAKVRQLPVMALIAVCGYQANFWMTTQLSSNLQVAYAVGAFVVGCLANLYSRLFHGLAAASMLPAIYCLVPGGLAASGSLVAGIDSSNQIFGNSSSISIINNGTQGFLAAQNDPNAVYGGTIFNVGYGMVQVAIGISVGLYLSALVVYPYGKRRSGLFSF